MENVKKFLNEINDGYEFFYVEKDGKYFIIKFDSFMVTDQKYAQKICNELNGMLKKARAGKPKTTR